MAREVYPTTQFKAQSKFFVFLKVNSDHNPDIAKRFNVSGLPALRILRPNGSVAHSWEGYSPLEQFVPEMAKGRG